MKKIITASAVILLAAVISGCSLFSDSGRNLPVPAKTPPVSEETSKADLTVYEVTDDFLKIKPLHIQVKTKGDLHLSALRETIARDRKKKYPICPENLTALSVTVKDGMAVADFSKELSNLENSATTEELFTALIVNTLTEFPDVKEVRFLQEGAPVTKLSGHSDMTRTLTRNELIIRK